MKGNNEGFKKPSEAEQRRDHLRKLADSFLHVRGPYLAQQAKWRATEVAFQGASDNLLKHMRDYKSFKLARNSMLIEYDIEKDSGELEVSPLTNLDGGS